MATSDEDKHGGTRRWISRFCRAFKPEHVDWSSASEPTEDYNCMGFVMGIVQKTANLEWWQAPDVVNGVRMNPTHYWPDRIEPGDDITAFRLAAESVGFATCPSPDPEPGYNTIVLYYDEEPPQPFWHAAIIESKETWTSKIAEYSDISHPPHAFDDIGFWGKGRLFMRRKATASLIQTG